MNTFQLKKVKGLGRGLSSLLGDTKSKTSITKLKIYDVKRNRLQPRKVFNKESLEELTNSIKERGVIQPIIVRKDKSLVGKFEIIAGERRWLASQNAGLHEIPVVILDVNDEKSLEFAIVENIQRQDLNAIEEAQGYQRLIDEFSYNQEKLAKFIGKSRSYIANSLRLLGLPKEVISYVESEKISAGHARSLIGLPNAMQIAQKIAENKLSVRQSENLVRALKNNRISELLNILEEVDGKVIIWAIYRHDIKEITRVLSERYGKNAVESFFGDTLDRDRQDIIDRFQDRESDLRFFVGNPKTGGYGLTLTASHTVIYYSNSYDLEVRLQSEDRAHRIGQTSKVTYIDLIAEKTVDEHIVKSLRNKINIATQVLGEDLKKWLI